MAEGRETRTVQQWGRPGPRGEEASLPEEARVVVRLNRRRMAELSATPQALEELALGHLVLLRRLWAASDVRSVTVRAHGEGFVVHIEARARAARRATLGLARGGHIAPATVKAHMKDLQERSASYREGGGVHTSALAGPRGVVLVAADVGKVNTLDRLAGQALRGGVVTRGLTLLTTGRLTAAMAEKAVALGCPTWVSHSGPTTAGADLARVAGATLIGYARGPSFRVYEGARRVRAR